MRRRKRKKQRKIIILSMIGLLFMMSAGYAAFQTNININVKGRFNRLIAAEFLKQYVETIQSGSGLYKDEYENNKYTYRGTNPDNYIQFNNELWRILSITSDNNLKIMKDSSIGVRPYDVRNDTTSGPRYNSNNTYCKMDPEKQEYRGCNVWSKVNGEITHGNDEKGTYYENASVGTVTQDSSLKTYLNGEYYTNSLSEEAKSYMIKSDFNVGFPLDRTSIAEDIELEKQNTWNGYVGLITASEYLRLSWDKQCTNIYNSYTYNTCTDNYIYQSMVENNETSTWTINGGRNSWHVFTIFNSDKFKGGLPAEPAYKDIEVRPVVTLNSNIKITGSGTSSDPYKIANKK